jgi:hypothetical protein
VEPVVAKRIETEIVPQLTSYYQLWGQALHSDPAQGFYPFAAPYGDPGRATDDYLGMYDPTNGLTNGLLPVTADTDGSRVQWDVPTVTTVPAIGAPGTIDSGPVCSLVFFPDPPANPVDPNSPKYPVCTFNYTCAGPGCTNLQVRIQAWLTNAAGSLRVMNPSDVVNPAEWRVDGAAPTSLAKGIDGAALRVTLDATLPQTAVSRTVQITFPRLPFVPADLTNPARASYWFVRNGWHRQTYYAVGSKFSPSATRPLVNPPCPSPPADCVSIVANATKARAVLVLAGRNLGTGTRTTPYAIANYFEGENQTGTPAVVADTPDYIFERKSRTTLFNDRLVPVAEEP